MKTKCILAGGYLTNGYANKWRKGKMHGAHRLAYQDAYGPIPEGMIVRHLCHVRNCINPEHLAIGTHQDNMDDKVQANRQACGETHGFSKFTEEQVREMIALKPNGRAPYGYTKKICLKYNINDCHLRDIWSGRRWKHIPR